MQKVRKLTMTKKGSTDATPQKQRQDAVKKTVSIGSSTLQVPEKDDVKCIINPRITDVVKGVNYYKPGIPKKVSTAPSDTLSDAVYHKKDKEWPKRSFASDASMTWRRMCTKWQPRRRTRTRNARRRRPGS